MTYSLILLAGGKGERFGSTIPKAFMSMNGKKVYQLSLDVIEPLVDDIIIVSPKEYAPDGYKHAEPGDTRSGSVENALKLVKTDCVIIHDAVRPFVTTEQIKEIKKLLKDNYIVDTRTPVIDGMIMGSVPIDKEGYYLGLTPEGFNVKVLRDGFENSITSYQDEVTMLYDIYGIKPVFVEGTSFNSKITFERDLAYAEGIMKFWSKPTEDESNLSLKTLVLGGSGGIGSACMSKLRDSYAPSSKELDLSKDFDIDLSEYKAIIHSAGEYHNQEKIMPVNFWSCVRIVELAEEQGWKGSIVFLSSTAATYGRKGIPVYSASKSALNAYIESRHEELSKKNIYINAIAPAKVDTKLQASINPDTPKSEMMTTDYVAEYVLRYTNTKSHGHVIYLRKGLDK